MKKLFITPIAILIGSIIIALSIIYYANNDPLSKCMNKILKDENIPPSLAAEVCTGGK